MKKADAGEKVSREIGDAMQLGREAEWEGETGRKNKGISPTQKIRLNRNNITSGR